MSDLFVQLLRHLTLTALDAAVAVEQAALTQWTHAVFELYEKGDYTCNLYVGRATVRGTHGQRALL